jgi:hypothetical protein
LTAGKATTETEANIRNKAIKVAVVLFLGNFMYFYSPYSFMSANM